MIQNCGYIFFLPNKPVVFISILNNVGLCTVLNLMYQTLIIFELITKGLKHD